MKKIMPLFFIVLTLTIYSKEPEKITLEEVIRSFAAKSNFANIQKTEIEKYEIEKDGFYHDKNYKIDFKLKNDNSLDYENKVPWKAEDKIYKGNIYSYAGYKMFFTELNIEYANLDKNLYEDYKLVHYDYKTEITRAGIGVRKSLNDIFYSEEKYRENMLNHKKKYLDKFTENNIKQEVEKLIDEYAEVENILLEIQIKKNVKSENSALIKSLKEQIEQGEATKIELDYIMVEGKKNDEEIKYLEEKARNRKNKILLKSGMEYRENIDFKPIKEELEEDVYIDENNVYIKKQEKIMEEETLKYIKRKNQCNIDAALSYDLKSESWLANLEVKMDVFDFQTEKKNKMMDIKKLDIEKQLLENENKSKERELKTEAEYLKRMVSIAKETAEVTNKKHDLTKRIFMKGYVNVADYIKSRNEAREAEINLKKITNNLNAFRYKNKIRKTGGLN